MKKALVILLALTMVMSMFAMVPASAADEELAVGQVAADYKPEGTAINNAAEFAAMDPAGTYYLAADITIDETYAVNFTGTFDGNGKVITTTVPVFEILDGTAKNITIKGAIVAQYVADTKAEGYIGSLAKCAGNTAEAYITNVCNMAPVTSNIGACGGIVGMASNDEQFDVIFTDVANYGNITCDGKGDSGGIVGIFDGDDNVDRYYCQFINCSNYGIINACGRPGGIIGYANASASFINCVNEGDIQATANYCGGIAGRLGTDDGVGNIYLLENCVNRGQVMVWQSQGAGMVGYVGGPKAVEYKGCVNYGAIVPHPDNIVAIVLAGIHGSNKNTALSVTFEDCVNYGEIGTKTWGKNIEAAGIAGRIRTKEVMEFNNCYNYGNILSTYRAGGIAASAPNDSVPAGVNVTFLGCGNYGTLDSLKQAAGITAYSYASWTYGPVIKYCFNAGNITGGTQVAGLIGYMNCGYTGVNNEIEYNFVAGELKGPEATPVTDGAAVTLQIPYSFTDSNGNTKYFYAPAVGTVSIVGDKVTFIADLTHKDAVKPVAGVVGFKPSVATHVTYEIDGVKYLGQVAKNATLNAIDAENKGIVVNTYFVPGQVVPADFDATTWEVTTYDHPISTYAYFWNNKSAIEVDQSKNFVAEGTADMAYFCGGANAWSALSAAEIVETPIADFANGTVAYELNEMIGETVFYQNIDSNLFVVDAFPTTDATHAKVVKVAGVISNQLFDINNDSGSPATGDAIVYVVVALAVSTISLAAVAVCKKIKEN